MCATRQQNTLWRHRHARSHSTHHRCRTATPVGQLALRALDFLPAPGFAGHTGRLGRTGCVGGVGGGARRPGPSAGACATACFALGIWTIRHTRAPPHHATRQAPELLALKVYPCDTKHACIHPDEREQREAATEHAYREGCSSCRTGRAAARMGQQRSTSLRNYAATIT